MMAGNTSDIFMEAYEGKCDQVFERLNENAKYLKEKDSNGRLLLHWAALGGHSDLVSYLIAKGQSVNAKDDIQMTPLILAASGGRTPVVKILIESGADVNAVNEGGHSALQYSASKGWKEIVQLLLDNGADVNIRDAQGASSLHRAASKGMTQVVSQLIINENINVDVSDNYGNTPLHFACEEDREEEVKLLLEHGADPNILNKEKKTPLQMASKELANMISQTS